MAVDMQLEAVLRDHEQSAQELLANHQAGPVPAARGNRATCAASSKRRQSERGDAGAVARTPSRNAVWRFTRETKIAVTYAAHLEGVAVRLPRRVCSEMVSVVREALVNVARHSGAANVAVELASDARHIKLTITDDGRGFAVNCPPSVMRRTVAVNWGTCAACNARSRLAFGNFGSARGTMERSRFVRVVLTDDHPIFRDGLRALLSTDPAFQVVGVAERRHRSRAA